MSPVWRGEVVSEFLQIVPGHEADMSARVPGAVPLGVGGRALDDLEPVSLLERQLLLVVRRERVQRHLRGRLNTLFSTAALLRWFGSIIAIWDRKK